MRDSLRFRDCFDASDLETWTGPERKISRRNEQENIFWDMGMLENETVYA